MLCKWGSCGNVGTYRRYPSRLDPSREFGLSLCEFHDQAQRRLVLQRDAKAALALANLQEAVDAHPVSYDREPLRLVQGHPLECDCNACGYLLEHSDDAR